MKIFNFMVFTVMMSFNPVHAKNYDFNVEVTGSGKAMILIPGLNSHGSVWDETVARYQNTYEIHVLTLPGFAGVKPMDLSAGFIKPISEQLMSYIDENNMKQPVVVGHSLGGFMALLMAIQQPDLFEKIIVVDSAPFFAALQNPAATEENSKAMAEIMKKQMQGSNKEMFAAQLDMMLPSMIRSQDKIKLAKQWGLESDGATSAQAMYELMSTDLREKIAVIKSPVLLLGAWIAYKNYGATHESVESNYTAQYSKVENFQIFLTDIGHHFIMWDDPEFYFAKLDDFLK